jgi:hypothetical protein
VIDGSKQKRKEERGRERKRGEEEVSLPIPGRLVSFFF